MRCDTHLRYEGNTATLDMRSVICAEAAASVADVRGWVEFLRAGHRPTELRCAAELATTAVEATLDWIGERIEAAAALAVDQHHRLAARDLAEALEADEVIEGLANFLLAARSWTATAPTTLIRSDGRGTILDPSLPEGPWNSHSLVRVPWSSSP